MGSSLIWVIPMTLAIGINLVAYLLMPKPALRGAVTALLPDTRVHRRTDVIGRQGFGRKAQPRRMKIGTERQPTSRAQRAVAQSFGQTTATGSATNAVTSAAAAATSASNATTSAQCATRYASIDEFDLDDLDDLPLQIIRSNHDAIEHTFDVY